MVVDQGDESREHSAFDISTKGGMHRFTPRPRETTVVTGLISNWADLHFEILGWITNAIQLAVIFEFRLDSGHSTPRKVQQRSSCKCDSDESQPWSRRKTVGGVD